MKVIIYSKECCEYCDNAVKLCESEGIDYDKMMVDKNELKERWKDGRNLPSNIY